MPQSVFNPPRPQNMARMISQPYDTDVLLIGSGPTGLSLAAALHQLGINCRLVEQKACLSDTTKATNLMQGTQEQLASYDLVAPMLATAGKMRRLMMYGYGVNLGPRTMHLLESVFPDVLLLGQDRIEASLAQSLQALGGTIEFGTQLTHLAQDADGITAQLQTGDHAHAVHARYAVGCDGPWGATRTFTACDFTPVKTGRAIRQVDVKLRWQRLASMEQMWLFYFAAGFAVVVPLLDGYTRVLTIEPKENMPARNPTLPEMVAKLREVTGDASIEMSEPKWFSYTELSMGIAPALRDGRVLLAGDAGNPILPNGGQGLNTGIQDSLNLAWKLAAVLRGESPDTLLDTYAAERLALRQALEKVQFNSLKYTTTTNAVTRWAVSRLGNFLLDKGGEYQMARAFSQLNVNYRKSPLTLDRLKGGKVRAGDRPANAEVLHAATGREVRLFDLLAAPRWQLVCFNLNADVAPTLAGLRQLCAHRPIDPILLTTETQATRDPELYYDLDEVAHPAYGIRQPTLLLIRPDQYVAVRVAATEWATLETYVRRWFAPTKVLVNV